MEKLYKINEVAAHFKLSRVAIYKWIREGKLHTVKTPSGKLRVKESELLKDRG